MTTRGSTSGRKPAPCGRCFIDVFACRGFDADTQAAIAAALFGGTSMLRVLER
jgi:hypothetical protein